MVDNGLKAQTPVLAAGGWITMQVWLGHEEEINTLLYALHL